MTASSSFRIVGIDPGSRITGFAFLEMPRGVIGLRNIRLLAVGVIRSKASLSHSERTGYLHEAIHKLSEQYKPEVCVVERAFTGINPHSALRLGETRGAIIAAVRRLGVSVAEITATEVKKTITGQGHASKDQVAAALKYLLQFDRGDLPPDASDAVAIGLSYGLSLGVYGQAPRPRHDVLG